MNGVVRSELTETWWWLQQFAGEEDHRRGSGGDTDPWNGAVVGSQLIEAKRLRQFRVVRPTGDEEKVRKVLRMDAVVGSLIEAKRLGQFRLVRSTGDEGKVRKVLRMDAVVRSELIKAKGLRQFRV